MRKDRRDLTRPIVAFRNLAKGSIKKGLNVTRDWPVYCVAVSPFHRKRVAWSTAVYTLPQQRRNDGNSYIFDLAPLDISMYAKPHVRIYFTEFRFNYLGAFKECDFKPYWYIFRKIISRKVFTLKAGSNIYKVAKFAKTEDKHHGPYFIWQISRRYSSSRVDGRLSGLL